MRVGFLFHTVFWGLLCFSIFFGVIGCTPQPNIPNSTPPIKEALSSVEKDLGIQIIAVRLSAENYMLDFRYRCLEPQKTEILFSRQIKPYLVHEVSGAKFQVPNPPKVGPMRQTTNKPIAGKQYFMIFANPGHYIKSGEKVAIVFGDFKIEHLIVE
jgi:hypothetical protein